MTTIEKLRLTKELMKTAENILDEIEKENRLNKSLLSCYGYSIQIIKQELNKLSDNSNYYFTNDVSLERIIDSLDNDWNDNSIDDDTEPSGYLDDLQYSI